jgi:hypothetical protein
MKIRLFLLGFICVFFAAKKINAQCNVGNTSPVIIGQAITDTAFCPSGGSISLLNVTGGGGVYMYEILAGPVIRIVQSQNIFNALPEGDYRVRVTGCNGKFKDTLLTVVGTYNTMYAFYWQQQIQYQSGLTCGINNNGVYKLSTPSYTRGRGPFRIQISTSNNFSSVPYEPGFDSALFTGLTASTIYYIRITDACNNFVTFNFTTAVATGIVPLSVPALIFQRAYYYTSCNGSETIYINITDSATGSPYSIANTFSNKVFWGTQTNPGIRMRIENAVTGVVYADRNLSLMTYGGNVYELITNTQINGQTGLTAPGTGMYVFSLAALPNTMPRIYPYGEFPPNTNLKTTIYFPGGDHCGTIVPAYSRSFNFTLGTTNTTPPLITAITTNCTAGTGSYFRVDFNRNYLLGKLTLVKPNPIYTVLTAKTINTGTQSNATINYTPLIPGETYRVIFEDTCGRKDSMNVVYNPGGGAVPPPVINDTVKVNYNCPVNPYDTMYNIIIKPLPAGYFITKINLAGYGNVNYLPISNWNNTGNTAYLIDQVLPPGTYTYTLTWLNGCQSGDIVQNITIAPAGNPPLYNRNLILSLDSSATACWTDGYKGIKVDGYLENINTNYSFNNLRLVATPNNNVFPLNDLFNNSINALGTNIYFFTSLSGNTISIYPNYSGIKINTGQEGNYSFAIDVVCPNGTIIETITRNITVATTIPSTPYYPDLKYSNALTCNGSDVKINLLSIGGIRPMTYEYKLAADANFTLTGNSGADSLVVITPAPAAGTIYDLRVTDACGQTSTTKVSVASFTGNLYIYQYPVDCINNPFHVRIGTSAIMGAHYTWKKNGIIIEQGYNLSFITIVGITGDIITVDVNIYDCYYPTATTTIIFNNPCNFVVLPVNKLKLNGKRIAYNNVHLGWVTENEKDISHFELEKSINADQYNFAGKVDAANLLPGNSYSFTDTETAAAIYYRLKAVDKNGKQVYSNIILIKNNEVTAAALQVVPNPARDNIVLKIIAEKYISYKAAIYNDKGQLVKIIDIAPADAVNGKKINVSSLPTGLYLICLIDNLKIVTSTKFNKQ